MVRAKKWSAGCTGVVTAGLLCLSQDSGAGGVAVHFWGDRYHRGSTQRGRYGLGARPAKNIICFPFKANAAAVDTSDHATDFRIRRH
jgi:hypothetical protein